MIKETLRLFNAVPIGKLNLGCDYSESLAKCVKNGFILNPSICTSYNKVEYNNIVKDVIDIIGINNKQLNASFHKSWKKIQDADIEILFCEQILHYITTYGFESCGIYNDSTIYIPCEQLDLPKIYKKDIDSLPLTVIQGLSQSEIIQSLTKLITSGIALNQQSVDDCATLFQELSIKHSLIDNITNKELKVLLSDKLGYSISDPIDFLRLICYKATGKTLLIKDTTTIASIKAKNVQLATLINSIVDPVPFAKIFNRFKPIFLACKNSNTGKTINKISKLSKNHHSPLKEDVLNSVTKLLKIDNLSKSVYNLIHKELKNVNIFRKIRLLQSLRYRSNINNKSILYQIRNGKAYAENLSVKYNIKNSLIICEDIYESIVDDLKTKVSNKKIYIPSNVTYALPATIKQFIGNIPTGSFLECDKYANIGVHWYNLNNERIDLDLSLLNLEGHKYGWNAYYRSECGNILYSGDMTNAPKPNGASEMFLCSKIDQPYLLLLNHFNSYTSNSDILFTLFIENKPVQEHDKHRLINDKYLVAKTELSISNKQQLLGLLSQNGDKIRFSFISSSLGNINVARPTEYLNNALNYIYNKSHNIISLNQALLDSGAVLVENINGCDIDLSPNNLNKTTILNLLI